MKFPGVFLCAIVCTALLAGCGDTTNNHYPAPVAPSALPVSTMLYERESDWLIEGGGEYPANFSLEVVWANHDVPFVTAFEVETADWDLRYAGEPFLADKEHENEGASGDIWSRGGETLNGSLTVSLDAGEQILEGVDAFVRGETLEGMRWSRDE